MWGYIPYKEHLGLFALEAWSKMAKYRHLPSESVSPLGCCSWLGRPEAGNIVLPLTSYRTSPKTHMNPSKNVEETSYSRLQNFNFASPSGKTTTTVTMYLGFLLAPTMASDGVWVPCAALKQLDMGQCGIESKHRNPLTLLDFHLPRGKHSAAAPPSSSSN